MDITIDSEAAREIVQKAIFESLDQDARNALVQQAVQALTQRPKKELYSTTIPDTPLEAAFNRAVQELSTEVVREYLSDSSIKKAIQDQIFAALNDIVEEKGNWLYDSIGYAVGQKVASVLGGEVL